MKRVPPKLIGDLIATIIDNDVVNTKGLLTATVAHVQEKDASFTTDTVCTALLPYGAECNAPDTTKYLIDMGANINAHLDIPAEQRIPKGSFLQQALYYSADKSAMVIINAGADLTSTDYQGDTPLHYALKHCPAPEIISAMIAKGADVHAPNKHNETPYDLTADDPKARKFIHDCLNKRENTKAAAKTSFKAPKNQP